MLFAYTHSTHMTKYMYKPELVFHFSIPAVQLQNPNKRHKPANTNIRTCQKYKDSTVWTKNSKTQLEKSNFITFTYILNYSLLHRMKRWQEKWQNINST